MKCLWKWSHSVDSGPMREFGDVSIGRALLGEYPRDCYDPTINAGTIHFRCSWVALVPEIPPGIHQRRRLQPFSRQSWIWCTIGIHGCCGPANVCCLSSVHRQWQRRVWQGQISAVSLYHNRCQCWDQQAIIDRQGFERFHSTEVLPTSHALVGSQLVGQKATSLASQFEWRSQSR